jgi:hypothetical protein
LLPRHRRVNEKGLIVILYEKYKLEVTPVDEIYWQLCREFGKREVDLWDDETYFQAWAALCVIGEHTEGLTKGESGWR